MIEGLLQSAGLDWSRFKAEADAAWPELDNAQRIARITLETLPSIFVAEHARRRWQAVGEIFWGMRETAKAWAPSAPARAIAQAIDDLAPSAYREQYAEVERLRSIIERVRLRHSLLARLEKTRRHGPRLSERAPAFTRTCCR